MPKYGNSGPDPQKVKNFLIFIYSPGSSTRHDNNCWPKGLTYGGCASELVILRNPFLKKFPPHQNSERAVKPGKNVINDNNCCPFLKIGLNDPHHVGNKKIHF